MCLVETVRWRHSMGHCCQGYITQMGNDCTNVIGCKTREAKERNGDAQGDNGRHSETIRPEMVSVTSSTLETPSLTSTFSLHGREHPNPLLPSSPYPHCHPPPTTSSIVNIWSHIHNEKCLLRTHQCCRLSPKCCIKEFCCVQ